MAEEPVPRQFPIFGGPDLGANYRHVPVPPPWRQFHGNPISRTAPPLGSNEIQRAQTLRYGDEVKDAVSAALALRRPVLVTGSPGTGKSSLAYAVAYDLGLGSVLRWNITSRSTLRDGLYAYDALDRLNEASLQQPGQPAPPVGDFVKLGPLGTALLPTLLPRVLLIDELDKSDIDLPNDLLHIFEDGAYEITELQRSQQNAISVRPHDARDKSDRVTITGGKVTCHAFPVVFLTSNEERQFSPAFLRRCVRYHFSDPDRVQLQAIARAHLGELPADQLEEMLDAFEDKKTEGLVATDQLLNALYLLVKDGAAAGLTADRKSLIRETILEALSRTGAAG